MKEYKVAISDLPIPGSKTIIKRESIFAESLDDVTEKAYRKYQRRS